MKKTVFTNTYFKIIISTIFTILAFFNIYNFYLTKEFINIIPLLVQVTLLILIIKNHKYAKLGIKIWSIFIIGAIGISLMGDLIKLVLENKTATDILSITFTQFLLLFSGLLILYFNKKTVKIE